ncbi:MAG: iron-containing alcohol dehydrogenase, partial [Bacteroidales bacterium]|nr:iron-containing alcohol dehydrogenase [Bacteroidales bacterium]
LFDVAHGAGLAAIWPAWARYVMHEDLSRFVSFAVNVMGCTHEGDMEQTALRGIEAMEAAYRRWKMPTCASELIGRTFTDEEIDIMAGKCTRGDTFRLGCFKKLGKADVASIFRLANR